MWVCDIMAGQRVLREMEGVKTQRYSLAFIITILPRAESERGGERGSEGEAKIDGKKRQGTSEQHRKKRVMDKVISFSFGLET